MALPLSGQISIDDIQAELGIGEGDPGFTDFGMDQARDGDYGAINQCSTYKPPSTGQISFSDWYGYNHTQACATTLSWSYTESSANGSMDIYINGVSTILSTTTGGGNYDVYEGDTIYIIMSILSACGGGTSYGNIYTISNKPTLEDVDCAQSSTVSFTSGTYTVVAGDIGNTITLGGYASCNVACL